VKIGDVVEEGTVLCVVEAMKLMNEVPSDVAGEVVRIFVENSHPIEFGQELFGIRPRQ
ncbi:MAG: acetyl-CoA carboxylase, biotin carboxyl carrier protein, partial [Acidobacteria bacterium]